MISRRWMLAGLSLLLLTGMRDPFRQPEDRCHSAELAQWRYQGMVGKGARNIGLLQDSAHRWRRVEQGAVLETGWKVTQLNSRALTVSTGTTCEPSQWQWQRQGENDEAMDSGGADSRSAAGTGRKDAKRDAGGG